MSAELPVAEDDAAVVGLEEARLCASKQKRYEFVRSLGQGAFGVVLLARDLESQGGRREVAVKIIKAKGSVLQSLFGSRPSQVKDGKVEAEMLFQLRHESIVEIIDKYEFKKKRNFGLGIVTEFCSNGNLQQHLESNRHPSRTQRLTWYKQLSSALEFIHSKGIVHRDLKPANVLVDSSENLKVADVGLAKTFYKEKSINSKVGRGNSTYLEFMTSAAGTPLYMAPEMWSNRYKRSCDVFSLGLVFVMISECPNPMWPFALWNNNLSTLGEVLFNNPKAREVDSVGLLYPQVQYAGKDEVSLLKGMLTYNMDSRPSMRRVREEVEKMMEAVEPTETPTWLINVFFVVVAIVMFLLLRYFLFV